MQLDRPAGAILQLRNIISADLAPQIKEAAIEPGARLADEMWAGQEMHFEDTPSSRANLFKEGGRGQRRCGVMRRCGIRWDEDRHGRGARGKGGGSAARAPKLALPSLGGSYPRYRTR